MARSSSRSLRIAAVVAVLGSLGIAAASCTIESVSAPMQMVVGQTAPVQVTEKGDIARANSEYCRYSFVPDGIVSLGPRADGRTRDIQAVRPGVVVMTVDCGMNKKSVTITVQKQVASFTVTPSVSVADGLSAQLSATLNYTDGSSDDVTGRANWTTDDAAVATMDGYGAGPGEVTGTSPGTTGYRASVRQLPGGPVFTATGTVTVGAAVPVGLTIRPITNVTAGETDRFLANGIWSDGTVTDESATTAWTTSNASVLALDTLPGNNGRVFGVDAGQATITGTWQGRSASILVTVTGELQSIRVAPSALLIPAGATVPLAVTATYLGPAGSYDRTVTPWATFVPPIGFGISRTGDAVSATSVPPFIDGSVAVTLGAATDGAFFAVV